MFLKILKTFLYKEIWWYARRDVVDVIKIKRRTRNESGKRV